MFLRVGWAAVMVMASAGSRSLADDLIQFTGVPDAPNGAWCWYQDERVVVDTERPGGPMLLMSTVSFARQGDPDHGDIDLLWYNVATGERGAFELHDRLEADDHDNAAVYIRPDGRYLAVYSKHSTDKLVRWRVSTHPHDPTAWEPERTYENRSSVCYANLFLLDEPGGGQRLYNFSRSDGFHPNYFFSTDQGGTWRYGGKLLTGPGGNETRGQRPYLKYAVHGTEALHFIATEGHPRQEDNGVYHGFLSRGKLHHSDGAAVGPLSTERTSPYRSPEFTTVLAKGAKFNGVAMRHAWTIDLHVDADGYPYAALTARADNIDTDHRFLYARWDGQRWKVYEIARAGAYLYKKENDYTGLVALHPRDPDVLFISTPVDPRDDRRLAHYELFKGVTADGGASWAWTPVTWDSGADNLRPVVPVWDEENTALIWLKGRIKTYTSWDSQVVGRIVKTAELEGLAVANERTVRRPAIPADPPHRSLSHELGPRSVAEAGRRVAKWQVENFENPPGYGPQDYWRGRKKDWVWAAYYTGLAAFAKQTQDHALWDELYRIGETNRWEPGRRPRHADDWAVCWSYAEAYLQAGRPAMIAPARELFDRVMLEDWSESLEYDDSVPWEQNIVMRELAWCDALFMGPPALTRLASATGDQRYLAFADMLWWKTANYLYDTEEHLFYRDSRYFTKTEGNGKKVFWARGNGWVFAGLTLMLEDIPPDHAHRQRYETLYLEMAKRLLPLQGDDGFWPTGLLDPVRWDKPESSGTAFFTYGLAWGINHGLLEAETYRPAVEKGWKALIGVTRPDGKLTCVQPIGADPYDFAPDATLPYGVGAFLLAASEVYKLALLEDAPSVRVSASNPLASLRLNETIELGWGELATQLPGIAPGNVVVVDETLGSILLSQAIDTDLDGAQDQLIFQAHFQPGQTRAFRIYVVEYALPEPTSWVAGRAVPERMDDYAWESDRIAYRVYGPALEAQNNAGSGIDVWIKSVRYPVVDAWYAGGDYHKDHGEGLDGYKVGRSRGAGGLGIFTDDRLWTSGHYAKARHIANGPVRVMFELEFEGWDTPLGRVTQSQRVSLDRGQNFNRIESVFVLEGEADRLPLAIGLVRREGEGVKKVAQSWVGYWEPESKENGHTAVGVILPGQAIEVREHTQASTSGVGDQAREETNTHWLALTEIGAGEPLVHYAGAGWSKSGDFSGPEDWFVHMADVSRRMAHPIEARIVRKEK